MKNNTVYQFVLFYNPTSKELHEETSPEIIDSGFVIAPDVERAKLIASRKLTADWDAFITDIQVLVRPF